MSLIINRTRTGGYWHVYQISEDIFFLVACRKRLVCPYLSDCRFIGVPLIILLRVSQNKFVVIGWGEEFQLKGNLDHVYVTFKKSDLKAPFKRELSSISAIKKEDIDGLHAVFYNSSFFFPVRYTVNAFGFDLIIAALDEMGLKQRSKVMADISLSLASEGVFVEEYLDGVNPNPTYGKPLDFPVGGIISRPGFIHLGDFL